MRRHNKNKFGFSLLEMVLAIAIIVLIGGVIAGICASISNSFVTTYNIDDSSDYAMLYARGFENSFLATTQLDASNGNTWVWKMSNPKGLSGTTPLLTVTLPDNTTKPVFTPSFMNSDASGNDNKWGISMFYKYDATNEVVLYRIFIKDNYQSNYVSRYDGSFWVPRLMERAEKAGASGRSISVSGGNVLNETTLTNIYGFSSNEIAQLGSNAIDETYTDEIKFVWG